MRTASGYQTPAVPYHTLICGSFSTPNTALVRKNAEYITNTKGSKGSLREGTTRMILETTNFTNLHESSFAEATDNENSACGGIRNHEIPFFAPLYYFLDRG
jgi:hypothetical protein